MTNKTDEKRSKRARQLLEARGQQLDSSRPEVVSRVHGNRRLTAAERLTALMDPDSDVRYGRIAAFDPKATDNLNPWVAETGGLDALCTITGQPCVVSTTDYTDRGGGYGAARLGRLFALAREHRWPVVAFVDGGGSRARHPRAGLGHLELSGAIGPYTLFDGMAELSGWIPTISIVSGPSFAGHASVAGFSDIVIATEGSAIGMGGPPMVEASQGKRLTPQELSSAEMQFVNGGIELLVEDEHQAIAVARQCLQYWGDTEEGISSSSADRITELVPAAGDYDVKPVIAALVDEGSFLELRAAFAPSIVVGFARLAGRSLGVIASNPHVKNGQIDEMAAQKISRHVEICDAWDLPIVALIDTTGTRSHWQLRKEEPVNLPGLSRMHLRCLLAHQTREVPLFAVQLRLGRGLAPALMTGYSTGSSTPPLILAWPDAELDRADGYAMVRDANAFDDIILPEETRSTLVRLLTMLPASTRHQRATKKRPVDNW